MLLIIGILLLAFGISDLVVAAVLARRQAAASGGLGDAPANPAVTILRGSGLVSLLAGAVLVVVGLAT